jgi:hypothetical protein
MLRLPSGDGSLLDVVTGNTTFTSVSVGTNLWDIQVPSSRWYTYVDSPNAVISTSDVAKTWVVAVDFASLQDITAVTSTTVTGGEGLLWVRPAIAAGGTGGNLQQTLTNGNTANLGFTLTGVTSNVTMDGTLAAGQLQVGNSSSGLLSNANLTQVRGNGLQSQTLTIGNDNNVGDKMVFTTSNIVNYGVTVDVLNSNGVTYSGTSINSNTTTLRTVGNLYIESNNNSTVSRWTFTNTGNIVLPANTLGINYANGSAVPLGGAPAGSNTQVQFNDNGVFGANAAFYYNNTTGILTSSTMGTVIMNTGNIINGSGAINLSANSNIVMTSTTANTGIVLGNTAGSEPLFAANAATGTVSLTSGTSGQVLTSAGAGRTPYWQSTTPGTFTARCNSQTINSGIDTLINWNNIDTNTTGLTHSGGVITNSGTRTVVAMITYQISFSAATAGSRSTFLTYNGVSTGQNRFAEVQSGSNPDDSETLVGATIITMAPNDTLRFYAYQTSGGTLTTGSAQGGMSTNYSTRLQIATF